MIKDLEHRLQLINSCLGRLGYQLEGVEPYHKCLDRAGCWLAAASTELDDLIEELQKKDAENT